MANTTTSGEIAADTPLTGAELVRIVQDGNNRKVTTADIIPGCTVTVTDSDVTITTSGTQYDGDGVGIVITGGSISADTDDVDGGQAYLKAGSAVTSHEEGYAFGAEARVKGGAGTSPYYAYGGGGSTIGGYADGTVYASGGGVLIGGGSAKSDGVAKGGIITIRQGGASGGGSNTQGSIRFTTQPGGTPLRTFMADLPTADPAATGQLWNSATALRISGSRITNDVDGAVLAAADSGKFYTNAGASARADFTLPAAAADLEFTFVCADADGIRIIAAAGDNITIGTSTSADAGRIDSTALYSVVRLVAIDVTHWIAFSSTGTWTVT